MSKVVAFVNQKGGVGKTTWNLILACYLAVAFKGKKKIGYIEFDSQKSAMSLRGREEQNKEKMEEMLSEYGMNENDYFDIIVESYFEFNDNFELYKKKYDVLVLDFPGTIEKNHRDLFKAQCKVLTKLTNFIVPIALEESVVSSSLTFMDIMKQLGKKGGYFINLFHKTKDEKLILENMPEYFKEWEIDNIKPVMYPVKRKGENDAVYTKDELIIWNSLPALIPRSKSTMSPFNDDAGRVKSMVKFILN